MVNLSRKAVASPLLHACVTLLVCLFMQFSYGDLWYRADLKLYDLLAAFDAEKKPSDHLLLLDLDDRSLSGVGQWPWPRYRLAALLDAVRSGAPALVGLDILFSEEDRTSLSVIKKNFAHDFGLDVTFSGIPAGLDDNDGYFAQILRALPATGAAFFLPDIRNTRSEALISPVEVANRRWLRDVPEANGVLENIPVIERALKGSGFINVLRDADGMLRRLPLLYEHRGELYPHMALAGLMQVTGTRTLRLEKTFWGMDLLLSADKGTLRIPIQRDGSVLLRFTSRRRPAYSTLSAVDVLAGQVPPAAFAGKIVLLGSSAAGLNDLHATSVSAAHSGPEIQATFFDNAFADAFYAWPTWGTSYSLGVTFLSGLAVTLLFLLASPLGAAIGIGALFLAGFGMTAGVFYACGLFLPVTAAGLTTLALALVLSFELYAREHRNALAHLQSVLRTRQLVLEGMAAVAEMRTVENDGHIRRTQHYVRLLAERLRQSGAFPDLTENAVALLSMSAPLHDIGKIAIPDSILFKPGKLSAEEFEIMKTHTTYGKSVIETAMQSRDSDHFLRTAAEIAISHHEKWDGTGYPAGLAGDAIPLSGRVMALADVYDALVSKRVYKDAFSHEETRRIILEGRGSHFDPRVVDAFIAEEAAFIACVRKQAHADDGEASPA